MSRGLGHLQRRIREVLYACEDQELPLRELRRRLGEPDRSNLRRAIRGLLERELLKESSSGGEPRVALNTWGYFGPSIQRDPFGAPQAFANAGGRRRNPAVLRDGPATASHRSTVGTTRKQRWVRYEHRFVRKRPLGEVQRQILGVLQESTDFREYGMPVTVVKKIVGADRSNARRAIRTLLQRGLLEESEDGKHIRLSLLGTLVHSLQSYSVRDVSADYRCSGKPR